MFNKSRLKDVLMQYKKDFIPIRWEKEKYKWEAIKCFQDNWEVNAADFADMLNRSLSKTINLLASENNFPAREIKEFAKVAPEEVRSMFLKLFDEEKEIYGRIEAFKMQSSALLEKYKNGNSQHYQYENAITTYLWLRYPDKYYIYKFSEIKAVAKKLESNYSFKKGAYAENIHNFYKLYDEICEELHQDKELIDLLKTQITNSCYPDLQLRTLTLDVGFYISRFYSRKENTIASETEWFPKDYDPGFSVEDWLALLSDKEVFTQDSLLIMKRMKDYGGEATCIELSEKYGGTYNFYNINSSSLARRIVKKTNCPVLQNNTKNSKWWPVLYVGKYTSKGERGVYRWKLRNELSKALDQFYEMKCNYWWLNANPKIWSFSKLDVGEIQAYTFYNDNGHKRRVFQNFLNAKEGDMVIGYESNPVKGIVAIGRISAVQDGEKLFFEKLEGLVSPIDYQVIKGSPELEKMEFFINPNGSLFRLTKDEFNFIMDIIRDENPVQKETARNVRSYTKKDFLNEVYMTEERYDMLVAVLQNKMNIIFQGAPGVGKTFTAKRLAYSIMGEEDNDCIEFVQFHQNYSYEDFMMGYKPTEDGFEMKYGVFYRFCQKAANHQNKKYFFIIDEINRGNLSKIFGELLMLIERDYRGTRIALAYQGESFCVPSNLYIIGMMNTADRSLAMIDYALRRRFSFFNMEPGFDSDGFLQYQNAQNSEIFNKLIFRIKELNVEITKDKSLGKGFCIGHSYFCKKDEITDKWLREVVEYDILPMLSEYWFDDADTLKKWEDILQGVFR